VYGFLRLHFSVKVARLNIFNVFSYMLLLTFINMLQIMNLLFVSQVNALAPG